MQTKPDIEKAIERLQNPRPGSKIAAAQEFGIDLTLLIKNLRLTPQERIENLQGAMRFADEVRRQGELARKTGKKI